MSQKQIEYKSQNERFIPHFGLFKPGDVVDYDETLYKTGLFDIKTVKSKKDGDK